MIHVFYVTRLPECWGLLYSLFLIFLSLLLILMHLLLILLSFWLIVALNEIIFFQFDWEITFYFIHKWLVLCLFSLWGLWIVLVIEFVLLQITDRIFPTWDRILLSNYFGFLLTGIFVSLILFNLFKLLLQFKIILRNLCIFIY